MKTSKKPYIAPSIEQEALDWNFSMREDSGEESLSPPVEPMRPRPPSQSN
ncbi:MAG: hypothetical protein LBV75_02585 [Paludibacter sp.]|nr:hypothetical protein [Paludibacter sp.]